MDLSYPKLNLGTRSVDTWEYIKDIFSSTKQDRMVCILHARIVLNSAEDKYPLALVVLTPVRKASLLSGSCTQTNKSATFTIIYLVWLVPHIQYATDLIRF